MAALPGMRFFARLSGGGVIDKKTGKLRSRQIVYLLTSPPPALNHPGAPAGVVSGLLADRELKYPTPR